MNKIYNSKLVSLSRVLRKNMTKEEKHLWYDFLKTLPVEIKKQKIIGPYIVDFYCASAKIVIEIDGSQHYKEKEWLKDRRRDNYLNELGFTVLRYSNMDINKNFEGVCIDIKKHLIF